MSLRGLGIGQDNFRARKRISARVGNIAKNVASRDRARELVVRSVRTATLSEIFSKEKSLRLALSRAPAWTVSWWRVSPLSILILPPKTSQFAGVRSCQIGEG